MGDQQWPFAAPVADTCTGEALLVTCRNCIRTDPVPGYLQRCVVLGGGTVGNRSDVHLQTDAKPMIYGKLYAQLQSLGLVPDRAPTICW